MLLEEVYEVLEAIDDGDDRALRDELGDLLFCVALLAQIKSDEGSFDLDDAASGIHDKMVRRHPHVFADGTHQGVAGWEAIKAAERGERSESPVSALDGVPRALPALARAHRIGTKASAVGFDWPDLEGPRAKIDEELAELDEAVDGAQREQVEEELGDVLFSVVNAARHLGVSAEDALRGATDKFERRFRRLESTLRDEGLSVDHLDATALEGRWQQLKRVP